MQKNTFQHAYMREGESRDSWYKNIIYSLDNSIKSYEYKASVL